MERVNQQPSVNEQFKALLELDPKLVPNFVPTDAQEQKEAYLAGETTQPHHNYQLLDNIDIEQKKADIRERGAALLANPAIRPKFRSEYEIFTNLYLKQTELQAMVRNYNHAADSESKFAAARDFMELNIDLYGAPDEQVYRSFIGEKLAAIRAKGFTGRAQEVADELFSMVDATDEDYPERFKPSEETLAWMQDVADSLYDGMLSHVPTQEKFNAVEIRDTFDLIIREGFGEAADGWTVVVEEAKAINVVATEKKIIIPAKASRTYEAMRGLVVHELGVHMMRSINGSDTDFDPLGYGISNYYDTEEGLGSIMEQAIKGKYREPGVDYYIASGLAYFENKSFDGIINVQWRLSLLGGLKKDGEVTDELIEKKRAAAYNSTYRVMRGTDELPWFKDLAYYNGATEMWKHLEAIRGDDLKLKFVLMGKANPASIAHERLMYETQSI